MKKKKKKKNDARSRDLIKITDNFAAKINLFEVS